MSCIRDSKFDLYYELYLTGLSLAMVAKEVGSRRNVLYTAFKRRGFQLRTPYLRPEQWFDGKKFTLGDLGYFRLTTDDRITLHRYKWQFYNGPIPDGYDIHHKDEDKSNNDIENYECLRKPEHSSLHNKGFNQHIRKKLKSEQCT